MSKVTRPTLDADLYVPALINWLSNKLSAGASQLYREQHDLGVIDWRVLATVAAEPGATAARICQIVGLDKAAVSRSFAVLERRRLLRVTATAGRARHAQLTEAGWETHDALLRLALAREARLLDGMTPADQATLRRLLHVLLARIPAVNDIAAIGPGRQALPGDSGQ